MTRCFEDRGGKKGDGCLWMQRADVGLGGFDRYWRLIQVFSQIQINFAAHRSLEDDKGTKPLKPILWCRWGNFSHHLGTPGYGTGHFTPSLRFPAQEMWGMCANTANTSSLAAKPHQSLFNLLTISSNIIPILTTVHVLLCFGPFLCSGGGGAVFILVPAEFWQCQGAAGGCSSPLCTPAGCQEKAEMMAEAMNIGSPPFLTDFLAAPACRNKGITLQSHRLHCPHPKAMSWLKGSVTLFQQMLWSFWAWRRKISSPERVARHWNRMLRECSNPGSWKFGGFRL